MPKLNPYLVKENIPKTEEIKYLDHNYQPMSYEEFMKTYEPNEEVEIITEAEYQDRILHGSQYGPGNEQSRLSDGEKKALSVISVGAAVTATVLTAGLAAPIAVNGAKAAINYASQGSSGSSGGGSSSSNHIHTGNSTASSKTISKASSPVWQSLKPHHGEIRTNGLSGSKRSYFTWDHTHCNIEKFNRQGNHLGSIDPVSGNICKPAVPGRNISKKI